MTNFELARTEERLYHEKFYSETKLYEAGSWLAKPVKSIMDALTLVTNNPINILDLGCGVGRNSIAMAKHPHVSRVVGVDLLDIAITKLQENARAYHVDDHIQGIVADVEHYEINDKYHFIVACSCLEHLSSEKAFIDKTKQMINATEPMGINCILMSTEVIEYDLATQIKNKGRVELNLSTSHTFELLEELYKDWTIINKKSVLQRMEEQKAGRHIMYESNWITFIAQNKR